MRPTGSTAALALTLVLGGLVTQSAGVGAQADDPVPSQHQVREARQAAEAAADDVGGVEAALAAADARLQQRRIESAQTAEAFNGARWRAQEAREAARLADRARAEADATHDAQAAAYADSVVDSYESAPELSGLTAVLGSDDFGTALDRSTTLENAGDGLQTRHEAYADAARLASEASDRAAAARADAEQARAEAAAARDAAQAAQDAAAAEAQVAAAERSRLIGELARLQGVSLELAQQRQAGLEQRARDQAAATARAAQAAAEQAAQRAADQTAAAQAAVDAPAPQSSAPSEAPSSAQSSAPSGSASAPQTAAPAPSPAAGAQAAIAFARAQIGEPYVWAAAGPGSWDCSGLTMQAWAAGGRSLPHYSVAQYEQSTPIGAGDLRPGDLLFWGSSDSPSSIYHVALYTGDGMMIHAPRTGRDVEEVSMYYWIPPNFQARP